MTSSISSKIVDWTGAFHDLTKGSFDSTFFTEPGKPAKVDASFVTESFGKIWDKLGGSELLENVEVASFVERAGAIVGGAALSTLSSESAGIVAGPVGAAAALAVEEVVRALAGTFKPDSRTTYDEGEWVMYDRGSKKLTRKVQREEDFMLAFGFDGEMGGADVKEHFLEDYGLGFYIEAMDETKDVRLFDYGRGLPVTVHPNLVMALPDSKKKEFDHNENLTEIREIWFADELGLTLNSNVPTDPGSEVVFKEHPYTMVKAHGTRASIEDPSNGETFEVDLADLKPGRTLHDKSWLRPHNEAQCREREAVLIPGLNRRRMPGENCEHSSVDGFGGFHEPADSGFEAGSFAWIKGNRQHYNLSGYEMVIIDHIEEGDKIWFYYCYDGSGILWKTKEWFIPLSTKENEIVSGLRKFRKLRGKVGTEESMTSYAIGNADGGIVFGVGMIQERMKEAKLAAAHKKFLATPTGRAEELKYKRAEKGNAVFVGEVGERNLAKSKDALEIEQRKDAVTATNLRDGWSRPPTEEDSNTVMYVGMAVAAIALVYFATK